MSLPLQLHSRSKPPSSLGYCKASHLASWQTPLLLCTDRSFLKQKYYLTTHLLKFLTQQNPPQVLSSRLQLLQLKLPLHPGLTELQPRWLPSCLRYTKLPAASEPLHLLYLLPNLLPATAPSMFKSEVHVTFSEKFILHQNG